MFFIQFLLIEELYNAVHTRVDAILHHSDLTQILLLLPSLFFNLPAPLEALQVLLEQSTKANSPLKGHERTVQYLQRLGKYHRPTRVCYSLEVVISARCV